MFFIDLKIILNQRKSYERVICCAIHSFISDIFYWLELSIKLWSIFWNIQKKFIWIIIKFFTSKIFLFIVFIFVFKAMIRQTRKKFESEDLRSESGGNHLMRSDTIWNIGSDVSTTSQVSQRLRMKNNSY